MMRSISPTFKQLAGLSLLVTIAAAVPYVFDPDVKDNQAPGQDPAKSSQPAHQAIGFDPVTGEPTVISVVETSRIEFDPVTGEPTTVVAAKQPQPAPRLK